MHTLNWEPAVSGRFLESLGVTGGNSSCNNFSLLPCIAVHLKGVRQYKGEREDENIPSIRSENRVSLFLSKNPFTSYVTYNNC